MLRSLSIRDGCWRCRGGDWVRVRWIAAVVVECLVGCDVEKGFERLPVRLSLEQRILDGWRRARG